MKIINQSKTTILAEEALSADTFLRRMVGLLSSSRPLKPGQALIIKPCSCVHTFFMRFTIDCLFVDKQKKVIKSLPNLIPFRITPLFLSSQLVVELPAGTITSTSTQEGDILEFL